MGRPWAWRAWCSTRRGCAVVRLSSLRHGGHKVAAGARHTTHSTGTTISNASPSTDHNAAAVPSKPRAKFCAVVPDAQPWLRGLGDSVAASCGGRRECMMPGSSSSCDVRSHDMSCGRSLQAPGTKTRLGSRAHGARVATAFTRRMQWTPRIHSGGTTTPR